jgi:hypothetical protein
MTATPTGPAGLAQPGSGAGAVLATIDLDADPSSAFGIDVPPDPALADRVRELGLPAVLAEVTDGDWSRLRAWLGDPMAVDSRANYAAWLRRQARAWKAVGLPAVHVAALDWPLASVRPQCLDVLGLIVADLRELSPRSRPTIVPAQPGPSDTVPYGTTVAAAALCLRVAQASAPLLGRAQALSAGTSAQGAPTRYLGRCADLAERAGGLDHEVREWGGTADPTQLHQALLTSRRLTRRLADALEAATRPGW